MLVFNLESARGGGGTERATEGGLLGGALEGARVTGGFAGEAGVDLSSLYIVLEEELEVKYVARSRSFVDARKTIEDVEISFTIDKKVISGLIFPCLQNSNEFLFNLSIS